VRHVIPLRKFLFNVKKGFEIGDIVYQSEYPSRLFLITEKWSDIYYDIQIYSGALRGEGARKTYHKERLFLKDWHLKSTGHHLTKIFK
jgi:hypothetical protein